MKHTSGRIWKIIGALMLCLGFATTLFVVSSRMRATNSIDETTPVAIQNHTQTDAGTRLMAGLADWTPATRQENLHSALLSELNKSAADALAKQGFKSVVLPDPFTSYSTAETAKTKEVLDTLGAQGVFRTLTLTPVAENQLPAFRQALQQLITESSFDALLLSDQSASDANGAQTAIFADYLARAFDQVGLKLPILLDAGQISSKPTGYQTGMASLADSLQNAELLLHADLKSMPKLKEWSKQLAGDTPVNVLLDIKSSIPNGTLQETTKFLAALQSANKIPLMLQSADYMPKNEEACQLLVKFYKGTLDLINATKPFYLTKPVSKVKSEQTVRTEKPTITFRGGSSPLFELTCNGKAVTRNESGDFSMDMPLKAGSDNVFRFEHQNKTYTVKVVYVVTVLESVSPRGGIETVGGIDMVVGAVARRGAVVKASLGSQEIKLQPGGASSESEEGLQE